MVVRSSVIRIEVVPVGGGPPTPPPGGALPRGARERNPGSKKNINRGGGTDGS